MGTNLLFEATATLPNGDIVKGPVKSSDLITFLFINTWSALDFYLELQKKDEKWFQSGGPEIEYPQQMVDELGSQIDGYLFDTNS